jgi:hypothetical protein
LGGKRPSALLAGLIARTEGPHGQDSNPDGEVHHPATLNGVCAEFASEQFLIATAMRVEGDLAL